MSLLLALGLAGLLTQPARTEQKAAISGQVTEEGTRAPIAGAQVTLLPMRPRRAFVPFSDELLTAVTDQNGRYEVHDLDPGQYRLGVRKAGFAQAMDPVGPDSPVVDLKPGERREGVNLTLQKSAVIVGRVFDEAGDPLANAQVMAMKRPPVPPRAIARRPDFLIPAGAGAETNDLGEFRLFGLPAGEYYVQAILRSGFGGAPAAPRSRTWLPTYFPGTADPATAQPIAVGAGQTSGDLVIRMVGAAAFQVSGVVHDDAGKPVTNALVRLVADDQSQRAMFMGPSPQSRTDPTGRFVLNSVTNGAYTLLAIAPVVLERQAAGAGAGASGVFGSISGPGTGGIGMVMTEMRDGTTVQYRDDNATRVPLTVNDANVDNLEVIVRRPGR